MRGARLSFYVLSPKTWKITDAKTFDQGYFCCKRRVLEFEEFLKIEGCAEGRHLFVPKSEKDVCDASDTSCDIICSLIWCHHPAAGRGSRELPDRSLSNAKHSSRHCIR